VRSDSDLPKFLKALKSKNLTIVLVYANWCPHCHTIMPHFDAASKSPNNTITPVKINETMLEKVNTYIKTNVNKTATPINVEGYPSIIIVNNKGDKITDVEPVQDTETLTKVMENAGPLAEEAKLTTTNFKNVVNSMNMKNSKNMKNNAMNNNVMNNALLRNIGVENTGLADKSYETSIGNLAEPSNFKETKETKETKTNKANEVEAREIISLQAPNSSIMTVTPPLPDSNSDMVRELEPANKLSGGRSRGGLMSAMARTAYTLAPSAVLLATSYAMNKKYRKTHRKTHRKTNRKTNRNNRKN
jgi:thiol-disulfide isomerase/thioredoxin